MPPESHGHSNPSDPPALAAVNAHGRPMSEAHGHGGCHDGGDLGPCDCLCHRDEKAEERARHFRKWNLSQRMRRG